MQALHRALHLENIEACASCCPEYIWYLTAPSPSSTEQDMVQAGQPTAWQEPASAPHPQTDCSAQPVSICPYISCSVPSDEVLKLAHLKTWCKNRADSRTACKISRSLSLPRVGKCPWNASGTASPMTKAREPWQEMLATVLHEGPELEREGGHPRQS